jgi:hypothetical protein
LTRLQRAHLTIAVKEDEHRQMMREQFPAWENRITYWAIHVLNCAQPEEALLIFRRTHPRDALLAAELV